VGGANVFPKQAVYGRQSLGSHPEALNGAKERCLCGNLLWRFSGKQFCEQPLDRFDIRSYDRERVVKLMSDAGSETAQGRHLFGLYKLLIG